MKGILEFDLTKESESHQDAIDGWKWKAAMHEADYIMRNHCKHNNENLSGGILKGLDMARDILRITCAERDLKLF